MRITERGREAAILALIADLGTYDPNGSDKDSDRARTEKCSVTFVELPDGASLEIYSASHGPLRGFHEIEPGERTELTTPMMHAILSALDTAGFPYYDE